MKLLRGSERDLKLDIAVAQNINKFDPAPEDIPKTPQPSVQVEGCKRFRSLCSRLVAFPGNRHRPATLHSSNVYDLVEVAECPQSRVDFHKTLCLLVRMGSDKSLSDRNPRRHVS